MAIKFKLTDSGQLAKKLHNAGDELGLRAVCIKQITELRNKAVNNYTPKDTGELRLSAHADIDNLEMGYTKDYAPHVEFGHNVCKPKGVIRGYVPGQKFLMKNVADQEPVFKKDLEERLRVFCNE